MKRYHIRFFTTALFLSSIMLHAHAQTSVKAVPPNISSQKLITPKGVEVPGGTILPYYLDPNGVKVFHLIAEPVQTTIYTSKIDSESTVVRNSIAYHGPVMELPIKKQTMNGWGYNGHIPGPAIIIHHGDRVKIIVTNKLPEPTTVHWHGLIVPNNQDGAGGTDETVTKPGDAHTYEFTVHQTGTFMYHSGFNDAKQVGMGLMGFFIALPKGADKVADNDIAIMLMDFALPQGEGKPNPFTMNDNWFTYNGLAGPNFPVLKVKQGSSVRIRFGNLALATHPIHLHGYSFNIVGTEGGVIPKSAQWPAATVAVAPGQTRDIQFVANNPGLWRLHCHKLLHIINDKNYIAAQKKKGIVPPGGMYTLLDVIPSK